MAEVCLAFMAFDAHELGCHFVARHAGLYKRHGLAPRLLDAGLAPALPASTFHAACGAALAAWLRGEDRRVLLVAAQRPMFWLYGKPGVGGLPALAGECIAGYPSAAPPALFLSQLLIRHGMRPDAVELLPARDDVARLGLVVDGSAAAAVLSSAVAPDAAVAHGLEPWLFFGDELVVATTGLAVEPALVERDPGLVQAMCACYCQALAGIHDDPDLLASALRAQGVPVAGSAAALVPVLHTCYTRAGRVESVQLRAGVSMLAAALSADAARPVESLYDFSCLPANGQLVAG